MAKGEEFVTEESKKEIFYNVINAGLAGGISFFSAVMATGSIDLRTIVVAAVAAGLVALVKFKNYWDGEQNEYQKKMLSFF